MSEQQATMTSLDAANIIIKRHIMRNAKVITDAVKDSIWLAFIDRLPRDPIFAFGFDGFAENNGALVGSMRCAIDPQTKPRYFACPLSKAKPRPFQYFPTEEFDFNLEERWLVEEISFELIGKAVIEAEKTLARFVMQSM